MKNSFVGRMPAKAKLRMSITAQPFWDFSEPPPFPVRRFTVEEYHRMGELGLLSEADRVELLEGWIAPKMIHNPPHDAAIELIAESLRGRLSDPWRIRIQSVITTDDSEPEPDLAIVSGPIREHIRRHPLPKEIGMVVEVSDTSLQRDRAKGRLYARAGIAVYWIVNLIDSQFEAYSQPSGPDEEPAYQQHDKYGVEQSVPLVIDGQLVARIAVSELLP